MTGSGVAGGFDGKAYAAALSTAPGVYRMYAADDSLLYVGKAGALRKRVASYFSNTPKSPRTHAMLAQVARMDVTVTRTEGDANARFALLDDQVSASLDLVEGTYKVGKRPAMMASDGANVWIANSQSKSVSRINATTGAKAEFSAAAGGDGAFGVAFDGTNIWVSSFFGGSLVKLSPEGRVLAVYKVGDGLAGMYYLNQHLWVVANGDNMVYRVRLSDGVIVNRYQVSASPYGILFDGNRFWTQASGAAKVSAISPAMEDAPVTN